MVATLLNIEGAPAIDLRLSGSGPLDQVDVNFSLDAGGDRIAEGARRAPRRATRGSASTSISAAASRR